jgi:UDP-N-acetyl-D-mannosaminuronate dehydrogenase
VYSKLTKKETKLSVIGLGYIGLPIALESFGERLKIIHTRTCK